MPDLEIVFKTKAELAGAQAAGAELERTIGKLKALGQDAAAAEKQLAGVNAVLARHQEASKASGGEGMFSKIKEGLSEIVPGFEAAAGAASKLATGPLGAIAVGFAAVGTAAEVAKKGLEEFAAAQVEITKVDAALAQSGNLTDAYREKLQGLAGDFQELTGVADDAWSGVQARLTQFGADDTNIESYMVSVKNLAGLMDGDVTAAANLFSRALQGNFEAFGRYGIKVEEAGNQTEKLDKLQQQLAAKGGGQLEARSQTLVGLFGRLKNSTSDVWEAIGRLIYQTGVLQAVLGAVTTACNVVASALGGVVPKVDGLKNAVESSVPSLASAEAAAKQYAASLVEIQTNSDAATASLTRQLAAMEKLKSRQDQTDDAERDLAKSRIKKQVADGKITPLQGEQLSIATDKFYDKQKFDRDQKTQDAKIGARQKFIDGRSDAIVEREDDISKQEKLVTNLEAYEKALGVAKRAKGEYDDAVQRGGAQLDDKEAKDLKTLQEAAPIRKSTEDVAYQQELEARAKLHSFGGPMNRLLDAQKDSEEKARALRIQLPVGTLDAAGERKRLEEMRAKAGGLNSKDYEQIQDATRSNTEDTDAKSLNKKLYEIRTDKIVVEGDIKTTALKADEQKAREQKSQIDFKVKEDYEKSVSDAVNAGRPIPEKPVELLNIEREDRQRDDAARKAKKPRRTPARNEGRSTPIVPYTDGDKGYDDVPQSPDMSRSNGDINSAGESAVAALEENTQLTVEALASITSAVEDQNAQLKQLKRDVERLSGHGQFDYRT